MRYTPKHTLRKVVTRLSWKARTGIVVAGCAGLAVAGAGIASASITSTSPLFTNTGGEAGYGTSAASGHAFKNVQAVVTPDQYGTTVLGGAQGIQLTTAPNTATPSTCFAAQLGLVANTGTSTYNIDYATGNLNASSGVADCATGGIASASPSSLNAALTNLSNNHSYWLSLTSVNQRGIVCIIAPHGLHSHFLWCRFFSRAGLYMQAEDLTSATSTTTPTVKFISSQHAKFVHASWGISQDTPSSLHACNPIVFTTTTAAVSPLAYTSDACQEVSEFDYATVTNKGSNTPLLLDDSTLTPDMAIDGPTTGALIDTHDSLQDTSPFTGGGITSLVISAHGGIHGASSVGNAFEVFTADSIG